MNTITGDHCNRVTDYTPLVQSVFPTLDSSMYVKNQTQDAAKYAAVAIAENIIGRQDHTGGNGVGAQEELVYTQNATGVMGVATMECVPLDLRNATRDPNKKDEQNRQGVGVGEDGAPMNTITSASVPGVGWQSTVRRLLPVECERLMGFPDNHTRISWKGKPEEECPDAPRYKAEGNSMAVNCMEWIGRRIEEFAE